MSDARKTQVSDPESLQRAQKLQIEAAAKALLDRKLVIFPTETVYGIGALGTDPVAIAKIFEAKERPRFNPLILHVLDIEQALPLVASIPETAKRLIARFWPGPLTLVLPKSPAVPEIATGGLLEVGLRSPSHPVARRLMEKVGVPIAAPSANRFMGLSATRVADLDPAIVARVHCVLDGGPSQFGLESTIVGFSPQGQPELLRPGAIASEAIETVAGPLVRPTTGTIRAPGMLQKHYAPRTQLVLESTPTKTPAKGRVGFLGVVERPDGDACVTRILSAEGDLTIAASRLFETLQELDRMQLDRIVVRLGPETGLGEAINDRLRRAADWGT